MTERPARSTVVVMSRALTLRKESLHVLAEHDLSEIVGGQRTLPCLSDAPCHVVTRATQLTEELLHTVANCPLTNGCGP